jgi:hypothetical protein
MLVKDGQVYFSRGNLTNIGTFADSRATVTGSVTECKSGKELHVESIR